ncbi:hypothetical protein FACI_IFERC00001G1547 [Ferroplasma acidarmanus Fer1]|uniref:Uncharacterized protein n=1 Tax=Ferroplasma acidarmanus Fer1 TaxID=333146 RepID=S0ARU9_FERAC|nr:hypothetical protein FACI_IFERC00001G1547 [Ferroplasma acidarmanus Fer1]
MDVKIGLTFIFKYSIISIYLKHFKGIYKRCYMSSFYLQLMEWARPDSDR